MPPTLRKRKPQPSQNPSTSPYFPKLQPSLQSSQDEPSTPVKRKRKKPTSKNAYTLPYSPKPQPSPQIDQPQTPGLPFALQPASFGLIQERICSSLYALIVQAILWNQTRGTQARPVLFTLLATYPTPQHLASANLHDLSALLQPIGLYNIRAKRLIDMAQKWLDAPPCQSRRYRKLDYPEKGCGRDVGPTEVLGEGDERDGWVSALSMYTGRILLTLFGRRLRIYRAWGGMRSIVLESLGEMR